MPLTAGSKFFRQKKGSDSGLYNNSDFDYRYQLEAYLNSNNVINQRKELFHKTNQQNASIIQGTPLLLDLSTHPATNVFENIS